MTSPDELKGAVKLGIPAVSLELVDVKINLDVRRETFGLNDLPIKGERCHRREVSEYGRNTFFADVTCIVVGMIRVACEGANSSETARSEERRVGKECS